MKRRHCCWPLACLLFFADCSQSPSIDAFANSDLVDSLSQMPLPKILSINELLFNPSGNGVDYVELVNVSSDTLDMAAFRLANRNSKAEIANVKALPSLFLPPGAMLLITSDTAWVAANYHLPDTSRAVLLKSMPSYANVGGCVVLLDVAGMLVDEFPYREDFHHPLVSDAESLSLEKLHPFLPSALPSSWTTASIDAGGGTPGFCNSQYREFSYFGGVSETEDSGKEGFRLLSKECCPRALSSSSQLFLSYRLEGSYVATVRIFDLEGFPCATLADNFLLGASGFFSWAGVDDEGNAVLPGTYIVKVQAFAMDGKIFSESFVVRILP